MARINFASKNGAAVFVADDIPTLLTVVLSPELGCRVYLDGEPPDIIMMTATIMAMARDAGYLELAVDLMNQKDRGDFEGASGETIQFPIILHLEDADDVNGDPTAN